MCQSLFLSCHFIKKETLLQRFPCEFCKIFWSTFFSEHLFMTAFILQQLLALYIAIIYSWKLLRSEKALVGKKNSFIYLNDFTDLDFFITDIFLFFSFFFLTIASLHCYAKRMLYSEQSIVLLARGHLNKMFLTNFENSNSISHIL